MTFARVFWPVAIMAALAACSGEIGGGQSTLPGGMPSGGSNSVQQIAQATATATPVSASNVATLGDIVAPQQLPTVQGWGGTIAFLKPTAAATASASAKPTSTPVGGQTPTSVSIGITAAVVEPTDAPTFGSKHRGKREPGGVDALFFISLLATADASLSQLPAIAINVPRDVMAKHRDDVFALALYDPEAGKTFRLAVAERDLASEAPGMLPTAAPPSPTPTSTMAPFGMANGGILTPPPVGQGLGSSAVLPPERIAFKPGAQALVLKANRPVVFALYAVAPPPTPTPTPTAKPTATARPASGVASPSPPPTKPNAEASSATPTSTASPTGTPAAASTTAAPTSTK
jgi:hypothetical protein